MTDAALCLWTLAVASIAFTAGGSAAEKRILKRQSDLAFEAALVRVAILDHVGGSQ